MTDYSQPLPILRAKTVRWQGQKFFVGEQGIQFPSVSTILNITKPQEARQALQKWRDRLGHDEANRITGNASRRGSSTHKYIRQYLLGNETPCPDIIRPYWDSLAPVISRIQAVRLVEGFVFHDELRYAGRVDCLVEFDGVPCLLDWKTADYPKGSVDRLFDGPLQLAAYCGAINQTYREHGVNVRHAALAIAIPDQPAELFWFDPEQMVEHWNKWQLRVDEYYRWRKPFE